jgi:hypothetical protein
MKVARIDNGNMSIRQMNKEYQRVAVLHFSSRVVFDLILNRRTHPGRCKLVYVMTFQPITFTAEMITNSEQQSTVIFIA